MISYHRFVFVYGKPGLNYLRLHRFQIEPSRVTASASKWTRELIYTYRCSLTASARAHPTRGLTRSSQPPPAHCLPRPIFLPSASSSLPLPVFPSPALAISLAHRILQPFRRKCPSDGHPLNDRTIRCDIWRPLLGSDCCWPWGPSPCPTKTDPSEGLILAWRHSTWPAR